MSGGAESFRYNFVYRDAAANLAEIMIEINRFDACMFIVNCDNVVPAYVIAALRANIPSVFVTGGYMPVGNWHGRVITAFDVPKIYSSMISQSVSNIEKLEEELIGCACPGTGACPEVGTANTMASVVEAMGLSLPSNASLRSYDAALERMAKDAAEILMNAYEKNIRPSDIVTPSALRDCARVVIAMGGSPNAILHVLAFATESMGKLSLGDWDELSIETPLLCRIKPNHPTNTMDDFADGGGVYRLLYELRTKIDRTRRTVLGATIGEVLDRVSAAGFPKTDVFRTLDGPFAKDGGIAILRGNLAPDGAIVKSSSVPDTMMHFVGKARVFESERAAAEALFAGTIEEGDALIVRYEGPMGSPGAREVMMLMHAVIGMGLQEKVAVLTDGRFSGTNLGLAVGHIAPEAPARGPIGIVEEGDRIEIDVPRRNLMLLVDDETIERRLAKFTPFTPKVTKGILGEWAKRGGSLATGGVLGK
jgi:dihydroxy-acid dehydratase